VVKPDQGRIAALERALGLNGEEPQPTLSGYVVLMDSEGQEASKRVAVTAAMRLSQNRVDFDINELPITFVPTRYGLVHPELVLDGYDGSMSVCASQPIRSGETYNLVPGVEW